MSMREDDVTRQMQEQMGNTAGQGGEPAQGSVSSSQLDSSTLPDFPIFRQYARTGATRFTPRLVDDRFGRVFIYWPDPITIQEYDEMRFDGQCRAGLMLIKLPIMRASWTISCSDPDISAFVQEVLKPIWSDLIRQILLGLDFGYCADEETEILTINGWKHHNDLFVGDTVLTINESTGMSEWQPVERVNRFEGHYKMRKLAGAYHDSKTTLNHRWITRAHDTRKLRWTTSEELNTNDRILRAAECSTLPTEKTYPDDIVEFVAWFLTEGQWTAGDTACLWQQNPEGRARIESLLTRMFGEPKESLHAGRTRPPAAWAKYHQKKCCRYALNSNAADILRNICDKSKAAKLEFVAQLTKSQLQLFVETALLADGDHCSQVVSPYFAQMEHSRIDAVELAAILLGYAVTRHDLKSGMQGIRLAQKRHEIRPVACARRGSKTVDEIVDYEGTIWCPTTANGTWFARRNGKSYFTGNSVFEKVWTITYGLQVTQTQAQAKAVGARTFPTALTIDRLLQLDPLMIYLLAFNRTGKFAGVQQFTPETAIIPANKCFLFSHDREFEELYGISRLRACYPYWYYKKLVYEWMNISCETFSTPIKKGRYPKGRIPTGTDVNGVAQYEDNDTYMLGLLEELRNNHAIVLPSTTNAESGNPEWDVEFIPPPGDSGAMLAYIDHLNMMILKSLLVPQLALEIGSSGSYNLAQEQIDFFMLGEEALMEQIAFCLNNQLINELVKFNFGKNAPQAIFKFQPLYKDVFEGLANTLIQTLGQGQPIPLKDGSSGMVDWRWVAEQSGIPMDILQEEDLKAFEMANKRLNPEPQVDEYGNPVGQTGSPFESGQAAQGGAKGAPGAKEAPNDQGDQGGGSDGGQFSEWAIPQVELSEQGTWLVSEGELVWCPAVTAGGSNGRHR